MDICIICNSAQHLQTVEHIIPRSLGNLHYILPKGWICSTCNNRFAKFENIVLNRTDIFEERIRYGIIKNQTQRVKRVVSSEQENHALTMFLLKIAYESLCFSKVDVLNRTSREGLRKVLLGQELHAYTPLQDKVLLNATPIPSWISRWRLRRNGLEIVYQENGTQLWFQFRYSILSYVIRLK